MVTTIVPQPESRSVRDTSVTQLRTNLAHVTGRVEHCGVVQVEAQSHHQSLVKENTNEKIRKRSTVKQSKKRKNT